MLRKILKIQILLLLCVLAVSMQCLCDDDIFVTREDWSYFYRPNQIYLDTAFAGGIVAEAVVKITNERGPEGGLRLDSLTTATCPNGISWSPNSGVIKDTLAVVFRFDPDSASDPGLCRVLASVEGFLPSWTPHLKIYYGAGEAHCEVGPDTLLAFPETRVGQSSERTVSISNLTPDPVSANRFRYFFHDPSGDCGAFALDPADSLDVVGPGETRDIVISFQPGTAGEFECRRELSTLRGTDELRPLSESRACPSAIVWTSTSSNPVENWTDCSKGASNDWHGVFGLSDAQVFVAGTEGAVLSSTGSCDWTPHGTGFNLVNLRDLWGTTVGAEPVLWAVGNQIPEPPGTGTILKYEGGVWGSADEDGFFNYRAVWGSGIDDVYVAGMGIASDFPNAKVWNGADLSPLTIGQSGMDPIGAMSGSGPTDIWAVVAEVPGAVYRFQGADWEDVTAPFMNKALYDVWARAADTFYAVYAVGADGAIYHFDGASGWSDVSVAGESGDFHGVWVSPDGKVFVVGEDQVIYEGEVGSTTWTPQALPDGIPSGDLLDIWGSPDGSVYAAGTNGVILRGG